MHASLSVIVVNVRNCIAWIARVKAKCGLFVTLIPRYTLTNKSGKIGFKIFISTVIT